MSGLLIQNAIAGVFQSELIVRTGILAALRDMRANPWLLDYMFYGLVQDPVSASIYGQAEIDKAKAWFINTDIKVVSAYDLTPQTIPCISLDLMSSVEEVSSLGDINAQPTETFDAVTPGIKQPNILLGPFTAGYDTLTGTVTIPTSLGTYSIFPGQLIVDQTNNRGYVISKVLSINSYQILPGLTNPNFNNTFIIPPIGQNSFIQSVESCFFKDSYSVGVHSYEDPFFTYYLYSILMFVFLRYKQEFFEARGFERTVLSAGAYRPDNRNGGQTIYSRYVTITGAVKYFWPKYIAPPITGIQMYDLIIDTNGQYTTPGNLLKAAELQGWILDGDFDSLGNKLPILP